VCVQNIADDTKTSISDVKASATANKTDDDDDMITTMMMMMMMMIIMIMIIITDRKTYSGAEQSDKLYSENVT